MPEVVSSMELFELKIMTQKANGTYTGTMESEFFPFDGITITLTPEAMEGIQNMAESLYEVFDAKSVKGN